ncbi:MAG: capsular biosynthesis protein, partial [Novosphingobium sp.]|nr:capsular biosynthesis protein [Novosphingobium sp.]
MTDQSKIPLPSEESGDEETQSLIERAVKAFDLGKLSPPPVPDQLPAGKRKPAGREPVPASPAVATPSAEAAASPVKQETRAAEPAAMPRAEEIAGPAQFLGPRHPVERDHLREQGLIVPEGGVTALLEEFRIVKRQLLVQA